MCGLVAGVMVCVAAAGDAGEVRPVRLAIGLLALAMMQIGAPPLLTGPRERP